MKTTAKLDAQQVANMEMEVTFRMKVGEWRDVMHNDTWMLREMRDHIASVLGHVTRSTEIAFHRPSQAATTE